MKTDTKTRLVLPELKDSSLSLENGVAILTLQRDDVRNALTGTALVDDILKAVDCANCEPRVLIQIEFSMVALIVSSAQEQP